MSKSDKTKWDVIRVSHEFRQWLREESEKEGRFMYHILENYVAKGMGGKRPWEKR